MGGMESVMSSRFAVRGTDREIEIGTQFAPKFDEHGLIACIVADANDGEVLMLAHMNEEALVRTIETGDAWFWSRSRQQLWRKGESSGNTLAIQEMRVDCDQDAILLKVQISGNGVACHTGVRSCFYRKLTVKQTADKSLSLGFVEGPKR
jgi:phosphoribosyl-AMP cyclohydrolase